MNGNVIEIEDMKPVEMTDKILHHRLYLHFMRWLGDCRYPIGPKNYPRLFAKFIEQSEMDNRTIRNR